ncbi:MAG: HipA domain-containing protein [Clostridiaceae bacterium]|nr:HipA domain-containing protein [Clostridiaceae bacterium]
MYCGKVINDSLSDDEKKNGWHRKCIKSFFNTRVMPAIDVSKTQLVEMVKAAVNQGLTIPGVQKKLSLHLSGDEDARLTLVDYPTGFILKPQTEEYDSLPEFEDLAMRLAEMTGIQTVPHALIKLNGEFAYITRRIDRDIKGDAVNMYAMEDFCQLSNRLTQDKYKGSYESCGKIIRQYSYRPGLDLSELFLRVAFSYAIGNSDMHLKNFSLKEMEPASRRYCLSKAYDMLPVNIIMPEDNEQLALTLNGKKRNIRRKDFIKFAENCSISIKSANAMLNKLCSLRENFLTECDRSYLSNELKMKTKDLIVQRIGDIELI